MRYAHRRKNASQEFDEFHQKYSISIFFQRSNTVVQDQAVNILIKGTLSKQTIKHIK